MARCRRALLAGRIIMSNRIYRLQTLHQRVDEAISLEMQCKRPSRVRLLRLRASKLLLKKRLNALTIQQLATA